MRYIEANTTARCLQRPSVRCSSKSRRKLSLTIVILVDERHPILNKSTEEAYERRVRGTVRKSLDFRSGIFLPDRSAQEVPKEVTVPS